MPWFAHRWRSRTCTLELLHVTPLEIRVAILISALFAPSVILAAPVDIQRGSDLLDARQARPTKPPPCVCAMNTTEVQIATHAEAFAQAFMYKKDISEAFEYISEDYNVCILPSSFQLP
jgi:hypothetical protein